MGKLGDIAKSIGSAIGGFGSAVKRTVGGFIPRISIGTVTGTILSTGAGAAIGAAIGGIAGTIFPGVGNAAGAALGAKIGAGVGAIYKNFSKKITEKAEKIPVIGKVFKFVRGAGEVAENFTEAKVAELKRKPFELAIENIKEQLTTLLLSMIAMLKNAFGARSAEYKKETDKAEKAKTCIKVMEKETPVKKAEAEKAVEAVKQKAPVKNIADPALAQGATKAIIGKGAAIKDLNIGR